MPVRIGKTMRSLLLAGVAAAFAGPAGQAQDRSCADDAIIVFDGSGSMSETAFNAMDEPRIIDARRAMHRAVPRVAPVRRIGLMIYGPGGSDVCSNVDLRFGPVRNAGARILAEIDALQPSGQTPLTIAVARAAEALGAPERSGIVVLVTDGKENCGGSPCRLGEALAVQAPSMTVHVIGFRMSSEFSDWPDDIREVPRTGGDSVMTRCLAERTGGMYVMTQTVDELADALTETLSCMVIGRLDGALLPPPA